jgi:hypothetical protein
MRFASLEELDTLVAITPHQSRLSKLSEPVPAKGRASRNVARCRSLSELALNIADKPIDAGPHRAPKPFTTPGMSGLQRKRADLFGAAHRGATNSFDRLHVNCTSYPKARKMWSTSITIPADGAAPIVSCNTDRN